ncbi:MAG: YlxR family protein [Erysipelotrichaceae bacterium]
MKAKKVVMRKCLATNLQYPKNELLRIVRTVDNQVVIDKTGKLNGRGAYIKLSLENIKLLKNRKCLNRAFECDVDETIYQQLEELINE